MSVEVGNFLVGKINTSVVLRVLSLRKNGVLVKMLDSSIESYAIGSEFLVKNEHLKAYKVIGFSKEDLNTEYVKGKTEGYNEGYQHGFTLAKEKIAELDEGVLQSQYNKGFEKGSDYANEYIKQDKAQQNSREEEIQKLSFNDGYQSGKKDGLEKGFDKGYNTAIKEVSNNQALGETTDYEFGTDDCCEHHTPNKETQEAMQEVLGKNANEFEGVWVAKDGSGKLKVLSINEGACDVVLVDNVSNSYLCVGDTANISVDDLKEHWTKEKLVNEEAKHNHYRKSVEHLDYIDIYRVCKLFKVKDDSHCLHHSIKKLLMSGQRGAGKSKIQDITEARDSLNSYLENEELFKGYSDD